MSITNLPRRRITKYVAAVLIFFLFLKVLFHGAKPSSTKIQHKFDQRSHLQSQRQDAVKKEFLHAWSGYEDHSWMADGLMPLSGQKKTQFCSWSATLVDALDTLWIMGLKEEFYEAVNATLTIDFQHNAESCTVSLFESTIRYLGGLIAAYDLSQEPRLLPKLVEVGDMLHSAFNTSNRMPCSFCHLASKQDNETFYPSVDAALADVGSLYLEFIRLSQITEDSKYLESILFVTDVFALTQNSSSLPGLWPEMIDSSAIADGPDAMFARRSFTYSLGALSDSSYEYLVKGHMLIGGLTSIYGRMWQFAAQQIRRSLLFRAFIPKEPDVQILFSGIASRFPESEETMFEPRTQHLACFAGGLFAIASKVFSTPEDFAIGEQLTNGCVWAYQHSPTGIMPETFFLIPCKDLDGSQCAWNESLWAIESGQAENNCIDDLCEWRLPQGYLGVRDPRYILRPEAIESVFIMWRMTGDEYWRDVGWEMFTNIIKHTRTPYGHAALASVLTQHETPRYEKGLLVQTPRAPQEDDMESFWFAETLKYFYLLFSEPDLISLDDWVLNTEAHPFRLTAGVRGF